MGEFFDGWIASESQDHDAIKVKRLYVDINEGNWYDAALFGQIMYWHGVSRETGKRRLQIFRDGHYWLAKRYEDWWDECRIKPLTAKQCISRMVKRGLLVKKVMLFDGKPMVHVRINVDGFEVLANHCIAESKEFELNRHNMSDGKDVLCLSDQTQYVDSITETTTQTTTEIKDSPAPEKTAQEDAPPVLEIAHPSTPEIDPKPTPSKKRVSYVEQHDALLEAFGLDKQSMTRAADRAYWTVAADLKDWSPERIARLYRYVKGKASKEGWKTFTVHALAKYAPDFLRDQPTYRYVVEELPPPLPDTGEKISDEQRAQALATMERVYAHLNGNSRHA